ncbi:MAG TPA: 2-oxo acid dehydrogenase subunit E2 [Streptosporangiaceae bacterium]|nr:2-oxo acid dehydrogenase subunit E2 [Streptosporangiaceae bacterium]
MSVSVQMPQLGESVTEGTVTRWLKKEGERVEADEPLLEVSTDKVDTEIPSPVAGILRGITVAEDETVEVGAELAVIDEDGAAPSQPAGPEAEPAPQAAATEAPAPAAEPAAPAPEPAQEQPATAPQAQQVPAQQAPDQYATQQYQQQPGYQPQYQPGYPSPPTYPPQAYISPETYPQQAGQEPTQQGYAGGYQQPGYEQPSYPPQAPAVPSAPSAEQAEQAPPAAPAAPAAPPAPAQEAPAAPAAEQAPEAAPAAPAPAAEDAGQVLQPTAEGPYVTPLVRKLASEHGIDLATVTGTGVGGRIRKQDVLDAARSGRGTAPAPAAAPAAAPPPAAAAAPSPAPRADAPSPVAAPSQPQPAAAAPAGAPAGNGRTAIVPSRLRGTTEQMSRARQVIAKRMVESLHVSAQLTTVVEADVTEIARLRDRAKAAFEAREGVKLSFLPFFALATVEALKEHPKLNAVIDTDSNQVTYHDAEHLGIAVDTERGLMVPVIRKAGDLNIAGLARKIADLADRTRAGRVSPDDLSGGTFTLTNTGSRGALFDTPIINQPQVGILGTGTVVKRPVVVEDPALGEVITVRSMVYLALTYDHRLVDGADAARFLVTVKDRLEEGDFATELGL